MTRRRDPSGRARKQRVSFVVRMADGPFRDRGRWRGEVEHVGSREKRSFQGEDQLLEALEELTAGESDGTSDQ